MGSCTYDLSQMPIGLNKVHPDGDNRITVRDPGTRPCACVTPCDNTSVYRRVEARTGWCSWSADQMLISKLRTGDRKIIQHHIEYENL